MTNKNKIFVIDTNILISAFILPHSTARKALEKASEIGVIIQSYSTSKEFSEIFIKPKFEKYLSFETRRQIITDFLSVAIVVEPDISVKASRDEKDDQFLELAISTKANLIISGDKDLLVLNPFRGIPILTASEFLNYTL